MYKTDVLLKQSTFINDLYRDCLFYAVGKGEYWNVEDDCIISTRLPLGLKGIGESVNYSFICLEKSRISFSQTT